MNARDENGEPPLHVAAGMNRDKAARLLIGSGASLEATSNEGITALDTALTNTHVHGLEHNAEAAHCCWKRGRP